MIEREHGVGLATAEVRLQIHYGAGIAIARHPADRTREQVPKTFSEECSGEKFDRVGVLVLERLSGGYLVQISRVLGCVEVTRCDIWVRCDDLTPRLDS